MNKIARIFTFALLLLCAVTLPAQARTLELPVGTGKLITLPAPAKTVMIADPTIADLQLPSERTVFLFANKAGSTTVYALDDNGAVLAKVAVTASHDISGFTSTVKSELPHAKISARTLREKLYISGTVKTPREVEIVTSIAKSFEPDENNIVNQLGVTMPTQVNIKVKFAEVSRNATEKLGLNWESLGSLKVSTVFSTEGASTLLPEIANKSLDSGTNKFSLSATQDIIFNALNGDGLLTTLAEPNLTVLSGKKATFNAGGEVPISIPVAPNQPAQVEYKEFGVLLDVEPTILSTGRISLHVAPEVSRLAASSEGNSSFVFTKNSADTYVELADGQSFVLAGLFKNREDNLLNRLPLLGDIPILGALFRSSRYQKEETELVIICTVNLVKPRMEDDFVLPTDGIVATPLFERMLYGRLYEKVDPKAPKATESKPVTNMPERPLEGQAGFYF